MPDDVSVHECDLFYERTGLVAMDFVSDQLLSIIYRVCNWLPLIYLMSFIAHGAVEKDIFFLHVTELITDDGIIMDGITIESQIGDILNMKEQWTRMPKE